MSFVSLTTIASKYSYSARQSRTEDNLLFGCDNMSNGTVAIRFRISADLAKEARFIYGDRVDILIDSNDMTGLIKRVSIGGWALSRSGSRKCNGSKHTSLTVKMTHKKGMPKISKTSACKAVSVTDEGILFIFPEGTEFGD